MDKGRRTFLVRFTATVVWLLALYVLWVAPSPMGQGAVRYYGLLGPLSGSDPASFWWLDLFRGADVDLIFRPDPGWISVAITIVVTIVVYIAFVGINYTWSRHLGDERLLRARCPRCNYPLQSRPYPGCSECGWSRGRH